MNRKVLFITAAVAAAIVLSGCSKGPEPAAASTSTETKKEPEKPPEPISARPAFFEMYKPAHQWASDALVLSMKSGELPGVNNTEGHAGLWTTIFVSPSKKEARTFTYAVTNKGLEVLKGVNISNKQSWAGDTPTSRAFTTAQFAIDSEQAYKAGAEKAAAWLKKHPKAGEPTYTLGFTSRFPQPVWYIMWGSKKDGYAAVVNALTGAVVTK